jgi:hypothetical protein
MALLSNDQIKELFGGEKGTIQLDPSEIRDISGEVLDDRGRIQVLPAKYWASTTLHERVLFGHRQGIYGFPTTELVNWLEEQIGQQSAIEIGAGHGVLAEALGIPGTDSMQQRQPKYALIYLAAGQPAANYGSNVIEMHASRAVRRYKPDVVIGSWVTHKWDARRPDAGGNEEGIDLADILRNCKKLILIGNTSVHAMNGLWDRDVELLTPDWLYSRAHSSAPNFVATWKGSRR